jgi:hypothetical protein
MNPLRLMTKGRTIRGLKERPGAYKLLEKSMLPNFSGAKRPAATKPQPQAASARPAVYEQAQLKSVKLAPAKVVPVKAAVPSVPKPVPAAKAPPAPAREKEQPSKPGLWSRLAEIPSGWTRQWNPWHKAPPFQSPTVQTELALDKVRVIRNDLCEDDLEVVMLDKKTGKKREKPAHVDEVEPEKLTANT